MGITIRKAMSVGGLTLCKVVAGKEGLDREIECITVMEVPDVMRYLKGNDLLLTSLYSIRDDEQAIRNLVPHLAEKGSTALGIKTKFFVEKIPDIILSEANRLGLPIIEIDHTLSYVDIMSPLMSYILNVKESRLEQFFQWVTELAMGGKGIASIINSVEQTMGSLITVESEIPLVEGLHYGHEIMPLNRKQKHELMTSKRSIRMIRTINYKETHCIVTPLLLNGELYGYVTCWHKFQPFNEQNMTILDRVTPLLALEFLKAKTKADVEQTYKDDFLSDILRGVADGEDVVEKAQRFGWDLTRDYQVIVVDFHAEASSYLQEDAVDFLQKTKMRMLRKMEQFLRFHNKTAIVGLRKEFLVLLNPIEDMEYNVKSEMMSFANNVLRWFNKEMKDNFIAIGIGRFGKGMAGIQSGYREAVDAVRLGKTVWGANRCVHYDDLGVYRILGQFPDRKELESLYSEGLGKLIEYDVDHNSNLVDTLKEYFQNNFLVAETAAKLFIHVNTLKYRLQKIEMLTGCNIHHAEDRLLLHLGLKIHNIIHNKTIL